MHRETDTKSYAGVEDHDAYAEQLEARLAFLGRFVSDHKKELIETNLHRRTRHITLVLEDVYQPQNASATLRTCECLGVQDIHIIENRNAYRLNPGVTLGAAKWVSLHRYNQTEINNSAECVRRLRADGYQLVATALDPPARLPVYDTRSLPLETKTAILFGTEELGLQPDTVAACDACLRLPMYGFTQSFNLSVSVGITFDALVHRIHNSDINWRLSAAEMRLLRLEWYRRIVRRHEFLEREFDAGRIS